MTTAGIVVTVDQEFEVFFRLTGDAEERVPVRVRHSQLAQLRRTGSASAEVAAGGGRIVEQLASECLWRDVASIEGDVSLGSRRIARSVGGCWPSRRKRRTQHARQSSCAMASRP